MDDNPPGAPASASAREGRPYLGVFFATCRVYGRLYRNNEGTAYVGRCPKCGAPVRVLIGDSGTSERFFTAVCP